MVGVEEIRSLLSDLVSLNTDMDVVQVADIKTCCAIIEDIGGRACLQIYISDGWATLIRAHDASKVGDARVSRTGRLREECALERVIVKCMSW